MHKPTITRVRDSTYGDWEAYYVDGALIDQNHTVDIWSVMQALAGVVAYTEIEASAHETGDHFPDNLEEVVRDHKE